MAKAKAKKPVEDALKAALELLLAEEQTDEQRLAVQYVQQALVLRDRARTG